MGLWQESNLLQIDKLSTALPNELQSRRLNFYPVGTPAAIGGGAGPGFRTGSADGLKASNSVAATRQIRPATCMLWQLP